MKRFALPDGCSPDRIQALGRNPVIILSLLADSGQVTMLRLFYRQFDQRGLNA
jgi:hypothetical protein